MIGITALFTALPRRQRAFQLTKCVDYHQSPNNAPVSSRPICPQSGDNRESLISFPHSPRIHILKPDAVFPACRAVHHASPRKWGMDWKGCSCVQLSISGLVICADQQEELDTSELHLVLSVCVCVCELHILCARRWWRRRVLWCLTLIVFQCPGPGWGFLECCSVWASLTLFYHSCRLSGAGEKSRRQRWAALSGSL